jgi:glycogen debranching enzyme
MAAIMLAASALLLMPPGEAAAQQSASAAADGPALASSRPVEQLWIGESLGNRNTYVTLNSTTDLVDGSLPGNSTHEFRESTNQRDYALDWRVELASSTGRQAIPIGTSLHPAYQETLYRLGSGEITKAFFVPFETEYTRQGHFLLRRSAHLGGIIQVRSVLRLPKGTSIEQAQLNGWKYALLHYAGGGTAILWGAASAAMEDRALQNGIVVLTTSYRWSASQPFALSFAYWPADKGGLGGDASQLLLSTLFDLTGAHAPVRQAYVARVQELLGESSGAIRRYVDTARLITPDAAINDANAWGKVNMLRVQEEYRWGDGFTNGPPADVVVARDSALYLMGSSYFSQEFSRRLLELWFRQGAEPSGKFNEYMLASSDPILTDDYGMNINDDTPLMLIAARQYYSLSRDRGFLLDVYPGLLRAADWIQSQRRVGAKNAYGLLWCTSTALGTRGLFTWRNIGTTNISGAVTEVNSEAYAALSAVSELAGIIGDAVNERRYRADAQSLRDAINRHLRPSDPAALYYLNINPEGQIVREVAGDEVFPVLYGVADPDPASSVLKELFSSRFFVVGSSGAGGFHTVSSSATDYRHNRPETLSYHPGENDDFGLMGGIWAVLGSWIGHAAALRDQPDLALEALRASALLTDMPNPRTSYTVPGEFGDGYYSDSIRRQPWSSAPLGPYIAGTFVCSSLESFLGLTPRPQGLMLSPKLPTRWDWVAASDIPYGAASLSVLALRRTHTLYATAPVSTDWKLVTVPAALQERFEVEPRDQAFGLFVPGEGGALQVIVVSASQTEVQVIDRLTRRKLLGLRVPAGGVVMRELKRVAYDATLH